MSWESPSEYAGFDKQSPSPQDVEAIHRNSDKDKSAYAQHHTLGQGPNQAAPGNHSHLLPKFVAVAEGPVPVSAGGWSTIDNLVVVLSRDIVLDGADRLIFPVAGVYRLTALLYFDSLTAGYRASRFNVNGVIQEPTTEVQVGSAAFTSVSNSILIDLPVGSEVLIQGGAETAMNIRGSTSGLALSRVEAEYIS